MVEMYFGRHEGPMILDDVSLHLKSYGKLTKMKKWQARDVATGMFEVFNVNINYELPQQPGSGNLNLKKLVDDIKPDLPWADDHFKERTSGVPMNPAPSYEWWPYYKQPENWEITDDHKFSHTYPERMWTDPIEGIRYKYGNLADVVELLNNDKHTRQAFLPIWFPEDTGAVHGERVPCTIGYQFYIREGRLSVFYPMRSCDLRRHFKNDLYMAARLAGWVTQELRTMGNDVKIGNLFMNIWNLHVFEGEEVFL